MNQKQATKGANAEMIQQLKTRTSGGAKEIAAYQIGPARESRIIDRQFIGGFQPHTR